MAELNGDRDNEEKILMPYNYLLKFKGKGNRLKIIRAFDHWLQVPKDNLHSISEAANMMHVGTLLIDDIQDDSQVRRGLPAAHRVYGVPLAINAGLHILLLALDKIFKLKPQAATVASSQMLEMIRGQGIDIYWREKGVCPTEDQYKHMAEQKTGRMLSLFVQIMQLFSEKRNDYTDLALLMGYYFQIRDDYCNLFNQEALEEWPDIDKLQAFRSEIFCEDITEGKFGFPIIHALQSSEGAEILDILRQRTRNVNVKKHCLSLIEKAGSLQYTRGVMADLDRKARAEVARFGGNPAMIAVLDELLDWQT